MSLPCQTLIILEEIAQTHRDSDGQANFIKNQAGHALDFLLTQWPQCLQFIVKDLTKNIVTNKKSFHSRSYNPRKAIAHKFRIKVALKIVGRSKTPFEYVLLSFKLAKAPS